MTTPTISRTLAALTAITLFAAGCGGSTGSGDGVSTVSAPPSSNGIPQMSDQQAPPLRLAFDVTIKGGQVTPINEKLTAKVGEAIIVRINSDAADVLHVHTNPDITFNVDPKDNQSFQFTVTVPGSVDVELQQLNRTIATITVQ